MQYPTKRYQRQKGKKCPNFQDLFSLEDILLAQRVNRTHQTGLSRIVICAPDQRYDIHAPLFPNASITEFMKHCPYWHIVLVPQLALEFGGGETLLRRGQQVHGDKPIAQRQLAPMHNGIRLQALAIAALLTLEALLGALPVILLASAVRADYTLRLSVLFQLALAALLVGKLPHEVDKSHIPWVYRNKITDGR